ncbi:hypothetical protein chiPu_0023756 [Chiloscyllium punctatum]|uniref:Uncharacterized protein n=1 Tax=Chiloscyllium punctatum TaxID=137246 RepID=A0A401TA39_CHIPU|nr:hypothetical protein [Chiloscyllium punctatum]
MALLPCGARHPGFQPGPASVVRGATSLRSTPRSIWRRPPSVGGPLAGQLSCEGAGASSRVVLPCSPRARPPRKVRIP